MVMAPFSARRTGPVVGAVTAALVVVLAAAVCWLSARVGEDQAVSEVRRATIVEDLCSVVRPVIPAALDLGEGEFSASSDDGAGVERSSCSFGGSGPTSLVVRVLSYDIEEGDPAGVLDQLLLTTCEGVAQQLPVGHAVDDAGCSGQDAESASEPVLVTATRVGRIPTRNAVVSVTLTDRRLPAQVAAYSAAITYGVVAGLPG